MSSILAGCCSWDCSASPDPAWAILSSLLNSSVAPGQQVQRHSCSTWSFCAEGVLGLVYKLLCAQVIKSDLSLEVLMTAGTKRPKIPIHMSLSLPGNVCTPTGVKGCFLSLSLCMYICEACVCYPCSHSYVHTFVCKHICGSLELMLGLILDCSSTLFSESRPFIKPRACPCSWSHRQPALESPCLCCLGLGL